jgi:hypothetical protein
MTRLGSFAQGGWGRLRSDDDLYAFVAAKS